MRSSDRETDVLGSCDGEEKKNLVVVALGGSSREKRNSHVYAVPSVTGDPIAPPNAQESLKKLLAKVNHRCDKREQEMTKIYAPTSLRYSSSWTVAQSSM